MPPPLFVCVGAILPYVVVVPEARGKGLWEAKTIE